MHITEKDVGRKVVTRGGEEGKIIEYVKYPKFTVIVRLEKSGFYIAYTLDGSINLSSDSPHTNDLVGFVDEEQGKEEMSYEPFDLERALAGEPVVTRDGREVAYVMRTRFSRKYPIIAVVVDGKVYSYTEQGRYYTEGRPSKCDLFMKQKTRIINGFEVPEPVTTPDNMEIGDKYYCADSSKRGWFSQTTWASDATDMMWLSRNLVFLSKEDAIANAKAMVGIDPYGD